MVFGIGEKNNNMAGASTESVEGLLPIVEQRLQKEVFEKSKGTCRVVTEVRFYFFARFSDMTPLLTL